MINSVVKRNSFSLFITYGLMFGGSIVSQFYPLATGFAINGALAKEYYSIAWLCACHFLMVGFQVSAKMVGARVFTRIYTDFATGTVVASHSRGLTASRIAGRAALLREYVTFLERDVPGIMRSVTGLSVAIVALFWLDPTVGSVCLFLLVPSIFVNTYLARKSKSLNRRLNDRLEREVEVLEFKEEGRIHNHFRGVSVWRVKLADLEAKSFGYMEIFVIVVFAVALWLSLIHI